jgi:hypothetical protein
MVELVESIDKAGMATTPEDIANTLAFWISDVNKKLNGQAIEVSVATERPSGGADQLYRESILGVLG